MKKLLVLLLAGFFFFVSPVFADYPAFQGYVNDFAHVLSSQTVRSLETKLSDYDKQTTNQIAVVTIDSTSPETLEDYSIHLADKWKVGQKGKDNGAIMLFVMKDRTMRIEVGRGLEGDLTDLQSKHILDDVIRPEFRLGNYDAGITEGVNAVIQALSPSVSIIPQQTATSSNDTAGIIVVFLFIIFFIVIVAYSPRTKLGGRGVWGVPIIWGDFKKDDDDSGIGGGGFGGFGGGSFSGGGSSSNW